ncbi:MAG: glycosyltransferase [bacterium]|nr:glycosyltransferase [bacterium]
MIEVSVIIPTYNRKSILKSCLEALVNQDYPKDRYEIIVVDDGSTDGTQEMIEKFRPPCRFQYLRQEKRVGLPRLRNIGIKKGRGGIIIFVDSDVIVKKDFINQHMRYHRKGDVIVNGQLIYISNIKEVGKKRKGLFDISYNSFSTANVSCRRKFLIKAGGFDERLLAYGWEDLELGYRLRKLGLRKIKNPLAIGYHYKEKKAFHDLEAICQKEKMRGKSGALYYKKYRTLKIKLATKCNPLFFLACGLIPMGKWLNSKLGRKVLSMTSKYAYFLFVGLLKLVACHYYMEGFREGMRE